MNIAELLSQYESIESNSDNSPEHLLALADELQNLSFICHTFYSSYLQSLSSYEDISHCFNEGKKHLNYISSISSQKVILKDANQLTEINLIPPKQLVQIFNDNFSEEAIKFCEIYFSHLDFFIALNIGVHFIKQA